MIKNLGLSKLMLQLNHFLESQFFLLAANLQKINVTCFRYYAILKGNVRGMKTDFNGIQYINIPLYMIKIDSYISI